MIYDGISRELIIVAVNIERREPIAMSNLTGTVISGLSLSLSHGIFGKALGMCKTSVKGIKPQSKERNSFACVWEGSKF